jgi:ASTRA-associated protein 1
MSPSREFYCTSSADAIVAKHQLAFVSAHENSSKPNKVINTSHSGQQGLRLRSDGTIFATAGWDCRIRVYSARSMKELAVLKWHREGCYALAFAQLDQSDAERLHAEDSEGTVTSDNNQLTERQIDSPVVRAVEQRRIERAKSTHWLAAGSKDGKVSLWDIY